jgi:kinesin family protein 1
MVHHFSSIHIQHALIKLNEKKDKAFIRPCEKDCRVLLNGAIITGETSLDHNDRIVLGSTHTWIFQNPNEKGIDKKHYPPITYEYSQEEIAAKAGINIDNAESTDIALLHEDLVEVMPSVEEANSISEELDKRVKFEIILIAPNMVGTLKGKAEGFESRNMKSAQPEVCVKMKNLENSTEFVWPKEKFLNRLYLMKEMYNNYEEEEDDWDLPEEKDPFQEDLNQEVIIGTVQVFLQPIAYMVEMTDQLEVTDLKGNKVGMMNVEVSPCDKSGREYTEADDKFVDSPDDLVAKDVCFTFKILNCRGLPNKYTDVHCRYCMYLDEKPVCSSKISLTANPDFGHKQVFKFQPATRQLVDYLNNGSVMIEVVGKQYVRKSAVASRKGITTKDLIKTDRGVFSKYFSYN